MNNLKFPLKLIVLFVALSLNNAFSEENKPFCIMPIWASESPWKQAKLFGFQVQHTEYLKPKFASDFTLCSFSDVVDFLRLQSSDVHRSGVWIYKSSSTTN